METLGNAESRIFVLTIISWCTLPFAGVPTAVTAGRVVLTVSLNVLNTTGFESIAKMIAMVFNFYPRDVFTLARAGGGGVATRGVTMSEKCGLGSLAGAPCG